MSNLKTVSDIGVSDVADYLRICELTSEEQTFIDQILEASKAYIMKYTGLDAAGMDDSADLVMAVYVICQDMYDNRSLYVSGNISNTIETILGLHSINLLPSE